MALTEFAKDYHEKMFPGCVSDFLRTDPEFIERFDNFAFDEVINQEGQGLDDKTRFLAAQGGCEPQLTAHAAANVLINDINHLFVYVRFLTHLYSLKCRMTSGIFTNSSRNRIT